MEKVDKEKWEQWGIIIEWLEQRKLIGDTNGAIYFIRYEDDRELFVSLYGEQPEGQTGVGLLNEALNLMRNNDN